MTHCRCADTLTCGGNQRLANERGTAMPEDFEETRRTADHHSPLNEESDFLEVIGLVLGRESATCEACGETVDPNAGGGLEGEGPFVIWELVENVYTLENRVLLCDTCINRPDDEWRADVRAKRARERDQSPTLTELIAHWLSDPRATSLFARRVTGAVAGLATTIALIAAIAGLAGSLFGGISVGVTWARAVLTTAVRGAAVLAEYPWFGGALVAVAYTTHTIERVKYDPRGYVARERPPWVPLTVAGAISALGALGLLAVATMSVPASSVVSPLAAVVWGIGAAGVAWYIDLAIRRDLAVGIWHPDRRVWMIAGRVGLLPGLLAITVGVPFAEVLTPASTGILAAIPAAVALGFAGRRLPYDPRARDRILELLPDWLQDTKQSD